MGGRASCGVQCGSRSLVCAVDLQYQPHETNWCGSDAFYRDAFEESQDEREEENEEEEVVSEGLALARSASFESAAGENLTLAGRACQQLSLKKRKSDVAVRYALESYVKQPLRQSFNTGSRLTLRSHSDDDFEDKCRPIRRSFSGWKQQSEWLGKTIPECTDAEMPLPCLGAHWKKGTGIGLPVRNGVKKTCKSTGHLYNCLTIDAVRSNSRLTDLVGGVVDAVPPPSKGCTWSKGCPLPRIVCINVMLPLHNPKNPFAKDEGGVSFVGFFEIMPQTIEGVAADNMEPCIRLWKQFCDGPCGRPGGPKDDPSRCLASRRNHAKKQDRDSGLFKATGWCENEDELGVPEFLRQFNGKSFVITESGYVIKDPEGEWIEIGFDVRKFNILFRDALYNFRGFLPKGQFHVGFSIQASEEDEMPEGLLGDMHLSGASITEDPVEIPAVP